MHALYNYTEYEVLWQADQEAFHAISQAEGASLSSVAALCLIAWDICITMDDENTVDISSGAIFSLAVYSLIALIVLNARSTECEPSLIFEIMSAFVLELVVEMILILRIYAIYAAENRVLRIMLAGFAIQIVVTSISLGISIPKIMTGVQCIATVLPVEMVIYSTVSVVYETFLFVLMMVKMIHNAKYGWSDTALMAVLVRDGAGAFLAIFLAMILNTLLFTLAPASLVTVGFPWLIAIFGSAGPRLIMNLRAEHSRSIGPSSFTDLKFTMPSHIYSAIDDHESDGSELEWSSESSPPSSPDTPNIPNLDRS
ncbi:hypothetical protein A0H81_06540 [Grifola frondosa]|uniref:Transmembrane protein n=1 Tax=Grifola frondosa TaxID=5627 RepID=A0A1C7M9L2_GRIFR|nr:hypothetical protein A0H81_06540 [Grifola frondosa]